MTITDDVLLSVNIPNMTRWVERLERNEDPQTKGALQRTSVGQGGEPIGFCCLGVACDEAVKGGLLLSVEQLYNGAVDYDDQAGTLPPKMMGWLGWGENGTGLYRRDAKFATGGALTTDNDMRKLTFPEIAAIVRREWLTPAIAAQAT